MNLYVGRLPRTINESKLRELFEQYGPVTSIKLIKDKFTGDTRGFAFVDMPITAEAQQAIAELNGYELEKQALRVNEARAPEARGPRSDNRFGGDRGGNRGNGGSGGWGSSRPPRNRF